MKDYLKSVLEEFDKKFDWISCEKFIPTDGIVRPCYKCGILTEFCDNCKRDHHIEKRETAIKTFFSQVLTNYELELRKKDDKLLKAICNLVESDAGFESDSVALDIINKRPVSEREKTLADLVSKIYKIVHPLFSTCNHPDWEKETENLLALLPKE